MDKLPWAALFMMVGLPALIALFWIGIDRGADREVVGGISVMIGVAAFGIMAARD